MKYKATKLIIQLLNASLENLYKYPDLKKIIPTKKAIQCCQLYREDQNFV